MNIFQIHISDHDGPLPDPLRATAQSVRQFHPDATYELYNGSRLRSFIDEAYGAQVLRASMLICPSA